MTTEKEKSVIELILSHAGSCDSADHKQWLLDQIVRVITEDKYNEWVYKFEHTDSEGKIDDREQLYEWDTGIAP